MLRVTVELIPNGRESGKRTLATAEIYNAGGEALSDYATVVSDEVHEWHKSAVLRYPRWSASIWDLLLRGIAKALHGEEQLPPRPTLVLELVPVHEPEAGRTYSYVRFDEIPEPPRTAFMENVAHSSSPGVGRAFAHDWSAFVKGQR